MKPTLARFHASLAAIGLSADRTALNRHKRCMRAGWTMSGHINGYLVIVAGYLNAAKETSVVTVIVEDQDELVEHKDYCAPVANGALPLEMVSGVVEVINTLTSVQASNPMRQAA